MTDTIDPHRTFWLIFPSAVTRLAGNNITATVYADADSAILAASKMDPYTEIFAFECIARKRVYQPSVAIEDIASTPPVKKERKKRTPKAKPETPQQQANTLGVNVGATGTPAAGASDPLDPPGFLRREPQAK